MNKIKLAQELVGIARELTAGEITAGRDPWSIRKESSKKLQELGVGIDELWFSEDGYNFRDPPEYTKKVNTAMANLARVVDKADREIQGAISGVESINRRAE